MRFQFRDISFCRAQLFFEVLQQIVALRCVGFFPGQMDVRLEVTGDGGELFVGGNLPFAALAFPQHFLRGFLIAPEIGIADAGFQRLQAFAIAGRVKGSSAQA